MTTRTRRPRVLLTNDDGPASGPQGSSPFVYGFSKALHEKLGWDVRVVVPREQKSWVGKAYQIKDKITGQYFYPTGEHGIEGERSELPRPLKKEQGEHSEWILISGTPATCANLAIHSLFPAGTFDLVLSGPNYGRNTCTGFALSSGTLGAALSASFSLPAIALSYGVMEGHKPPRADVIERAYEVSCDVVAKLWQTGWSGVDVYSVNVPLMPKILDEPSIHWTHIGRKAYQRLFKHADDVEGDRSDGGAGPAAIPEPTKGDEGAERSDHTEGDAIGVLDEHVSRPLHFVFSPALGPLINPPASEVQEPGSDIAVMDAGGISVTPLRASFEHAVIPEAIAHQGPHRKWRL